MRTIGESQAPEPYRSIFVPHNNVFSGPIALGPSAAAHCDAAANTVWDVRRDGAFDRNNVAPLTQANDVLKQPAFDERLSG